MHCPRGGSCLPPSVPTGRRCRVKTVEWQTEIPGRLAEFRQILREAQAYYVTRPNSEAETRLYIRADGRVGGRRMLGRFEMTPADGFTWPIADVDRTHPNGRGWMGFSVDQAYAN